MLSLKKYSNFITIAIVALSYGHTAVADETSPYTLKQIQALHKGLQKAKATAEEKQERALYMLKEIRSGRGKNHWTKELDKEYTTHLGYWQTVSGSYELAETRAADRIRAVDFLIKIVKPAAEAAEKVEALKAAIESAKGTTDSAKISALLIELSNAEVTLDSARKLMEESDKMVDIAEAGNDKTTPFWPTPSDSDYTGNTDNEKEYSQTAGFKWALNEARKNDCDFIGNVIDSENTGYNGQWRFRVIENIRSGLTPTHLEKDFLAIQESKKPALEQLQKRIAENAAKIDHELSLNPSPSAYNRLRAEQTLLQSQKGLVDQSIKHSRLTNDPVKINAFAGLEATVRGGAVILEATKKTPLSKVDYYTSMDQLQAGIPNFAIELKNNILTAKGHAHPGCVNQLRISMGAYDKVNKVHPIIVTRHSNEGETDYCTRDGINRCKAEGNCVDIADLFGKHRLSKDGYIRLAKVAYTDGNVDPTSYQPIQGLEEMFLTNSTKFEQELRLEEEASQREAQEQLDAILREQEARIAAVCEAAERGDKNALDELASLGIDISVYINALRDKEIKALEKKLEDAEGFSGRKKLNKLEALIKEIEAFAKANPDMKDKAIEMLLAVKDAALDLESADDESAGAMQTHGSRGYIVARKAVKAAKKIDPKNEDVRTAMNDLVAGETKFAATTGEPFYYSTARTAAIQRVLELAHQRARSAWTGRAPNVETSVQMNTLVQAINQSDKEFVKAQKRTVEAEVSSYADLDGLLNRQPGSKDEKPSATPHVHPHTHVYPWSYPSYQTYPSYPGYTYPQYNHLYTGGARF